MGKNSVGAKLQPQETPEAQPDNRHPPDPRRPLPGSASGTHGELRLRTEVSARRTNERRGGRALGRDPVSASGGHRCALFCYVSLASEVSAGR